MRRNFWAVGLIFCVALASNSTLSLAEDSGQPAWKSFCSSEKIKNLILELLNGSPEFKSKNVLASDLRDVTTLSVDGIKQKFSCRGSVVAPNGVSIPGVVTVTANNKGTSLDWYYDNASTGLDALADTGAQLPADQLLFLKTLQTAREQYDKAKTDFSKGAARPLRAKAICTEFSSPTVRNWRGKVIRLTTNNSGKGVIGIEIGPGIIVRTFDIALADIGSKTLIEPGTKLFEQLGELSDADEVKFSGTFILSETDCFRENSLSIKGSLTEPEFVMKFDDVKKIAR